MRKQNANDTDDAKDDGKRIQHQAGETPCFLFALVDLVIGKDLYKGSRQGPLSKEIAEHIRYTKGDLICVINKARAKVAGKDHLPHKPQKSREHYRDRHNTCRSSDA